MAPVAGGPFVVLLDDHGTRQEQQGSGVGEDTEGVGAAFDPFVDPF